MIMKTNKIFAGLVLVTLALSGAVSCQSEQPVPYEPAAQVSGPQVFFPNTIASKISFDEETVSFDIPISRVDTTEALSVAIAASGEGVESGAFTVPSSVSFAKDEADAVITVTLDHEKIEVNVFLGLSLAIPEELATPYGTSLLSITAGIELPWIKFDEGTLTETWWDEVEEKKVLEYQQISDTVRFCRIKDCFGYETIKKGEDYDVQDYVFYWNTNTNAVYVPMRYMGYPDDAPVYYADETSFYNDYWIGSSNPSGHIEGTKEWFDFADMFRNKYPEDYYPYYDGNGGFYLADFYVVGSKAKGDYLGVYTGGDGEIDYFICKSFVRADYAIEPSYGGMRIGSDNTTVSYVVNVIAAEDVASVICGASAEDDYETILEALKEGEPLASATVVDTVATLVLEGLDPGKYKIVVVPVNADGEAQYDFAVNASYKFPGLGTQDDPEILPVEGLYVVDPEYNPFLVNLTEIGPDLYALQADWFGIFEGWADPILVLDLDSSEQTLTCNDRIVYEGEIEDGVYGYGFYDLPEDPENYFLCFWGSGQSGTEPIVITYDSNGELSSISYCEYGVSSSADGSYQGYYAYVDDDTPIVKYVEEEPSASPAKVKASCQRNGFRTATRSRKPAPKDFTLRTITLK